ncbi:thiol-disulfide oxidoreductase ResA [Jeotgalibacillus sp. S-D1]|uniref:thiol-disulfide oxidoreductase ResA n=1 Tax=Jeotgalibacillus sp. S-D1 TaxID=2552189 RepID=UPI00105976E1|nr:thiol-disulfide oxidoreductase ResA [Jeotgalibacillus sp. S-D1]TDL34697.1 thiol-disulfide oxidoreductase ResA [Jeotgalibacillus sp. S-D1]
MSKRKKKRLILRISILTVLIAAVAYTLYSTLTDEEKTLVKAGDNAPDFVLTDLDGKQHRLSDYEGQGVFLNFWGTWCKPCEKEMPYMESQYHEFKDQGVQTIAVNVGESDFQVRNFAEKYNLSFPVVRDAQRDVYDAYSIGTLPTTLLISPEGEVVDVVKGEMTEETIASYMEQIKP